MYDKEILLTINESTLAKYSEYYFKQHPKAKKDPIDSPYHPSINVWMIMKRPVMNGLKQKWKSFLIWFIEDCGYTNLHINECEITFTVFFKTRVRHDPDNSVPKFILDGMVESGFITDDDSHHLKSLTLRCDYDKDNPRTEILIKFKGEL